MEPMPLDWPAAEIAQRATVRCRAGYGVCLFATVTQARTARKVVQELRAAGLDVFFGENEDGLYVVAGQDDSKGALVGTVR